jgi:hypothetical protein
METPYKISSRALLPPALRTGKFTVECPCPDAFRRGFSAQNDKDERSVSPGNGNRAIHGYTGETVRKALFSVHGDIDLTFLLFAPLALRA